MHTLIWDTLCVACADYDAPNLERNAIPCVSFASRRIASTESRNGRERPHDFFGRLEAQKAGSLPPILDLFPPVLFEPEFAMRFSSEQIERARVKIVVLTMMQKEIITFFTTEGRGLHGPETLHTAIHFNLYGAEAFELPVISRIKYSLLNVQLSAG